MTFTTRTLKERCDHFKKFNPQENLIFPRKKQTTQSSFPFLLTISMNSVNSENSLNSLKSLFIFEWKICGYSSKILRVCQFVWIFRLTMKMIIFNF